MLVWILERTTYQRLITWEIIYDRVPYGMEIQYSRSTLVRNYFQISTLVTLWEIMINLRYSVQWLMNISVVVDNEPESEWLLLLFILEVFLNCLNISCAFSRFISFQESGKSIQSIGNFSWGGLEVWEVFLRSTLIVIRLVDEMPAKLPVHSFFHDKISKGSTFSERMILLWFHKISILFALWEWL